MSEHLPFQPNEKQLQIIGKALYEMHLSYGIKKDGLRYSDLTCRENIKDTLRKMMQDFHLLCAEGDIDLPNDHADYAYMVGNLCDMIDALFGQTVLPAIENMEPQCVSA